jgi:hypothetical protein
VPPQSRILYQLFAIVLIQIYANASSIPTRVGVIEAKWVVMVVLDDIIKSSSKAAIVTITNDRY